MDDALRHGEGEPGVSEAEIRGVADRLQIANFGSQFC